MNCLADCVKHWTIENQMLEIARDVSNCSVVTTYEDIQMDRVSRRTRYLYMERVVDGYHDCGLVRSRLVLVHYRDDLDEN